MAVWRDRRRADLGDLALMSRRFPPPWTVEETDACFIVRDGKGQTLAYTYFEDEPGRRAARTSSPATRPGGSRRTSPSRPSEWREIANFWPSITRRDAPLCCKRREQRGILTCPPDDDARSRAMSHVLIAIVDDEEPVRDATKTLVRSLGY